MDDGRVDHVGERQLAVVDREPQLPPLAVEAGRPAGALGCDVPPAGVEDLDGRKDGACDSAARVVEEDDGAVVTDARGEGGVELPAPGALALAPRDGEELLRPLAVDDHGRATEVGRLRDAVGVADDLAAVLHGAEADRTGGAGDGVAAALEADAHTGGGRPDERGGGVGGAERIRQEGGLIVRASEQRGACQEARGRGEGDDEREHDAQAKPRRSRAIPGPQLIVLRHVDNPPSVEPVRCGRNRLPLRFESSGGVADLSGTRACASESGRRSPGRVR